MLKVKEKVKGDAEQILHALCSMLSPSRKINCIACLCSYSKLHDFMTKASFFLGPVFIPSAIALTWICDPVSKSLSWESVVDCKNSHHFLNDSPEISQDDDCHHEWSQRDGVPHRVDEIETVEDLLLNMDRNTKTKRDCSIFCLYLS